MPTTKEFREFFLRHNKVNTGSKPDKEFNYPLQYLVNGTKLVYNRFLKNDFPSEDVFKKLFESQTFKLNQEDTAKLTEQGLAKIATDANAESNTSNGSIDFTAVVVPHQLPEVIVTDGVTESAPVVAEDGGMKVTTYRRTVAGLFRKVFKVEVNVQDSVVIDGTSKKVKLDGDVAAPSDGYYYGKESGAKGWFDLKTFISDALTVLNNSLINYIDTEINNVVNTIDVNTTPLTGVNADCLTPPGTETIPEWISLLNAEICALKAITPPSFGNSIDFDSGYNSANGKNSGSINSITTVNIAAQLGGLPSHVWQVPSIANGDPTDVTSIQIEVWSGGGGYDIGAGNDEGNALAGTVSKIIKAYQGANPSGVNGGAGGTTDAGDANNSGSNGTNGTNGQAGGMGGSGYPPDFNYMGAPAVIGVGGVGGIGGTGGLGGAGGSVGYGNGANGNNGANGTPGLNGIPAANGDSGADGEGGGGGGAYGMEVITVTPGEFVYVYTFIDTFASGQNSKVKISW